MSKLGHNTNCLISWKVKKSSGIEIWPTWFSRDQELNLDHNLTLVNSQYIQGTLLEIRYCERGLWNIF